MKVPFVSFTERNKRVKAETLKTFEAFFDSSWYVLGGYTKQFEEEYAAFSGTSHCIGVSTGLDALHLSLIALGIKSGDEVIVASNSYIATVLAVLYTGATPVFVEPRLETANINPSEIEKAITPRTKCIMPVHLYGQACEMNSIMDIARKHDLYVIEDNAQAQGASYDGRQTGSFGHLNATSFYPTKNLGALGEAGAVTTNNPDLAEQISILRNYGTREKYINDVLGYNNRIDEFEAAYLSIALKHLDRWNEERKQIAILYDQQLEDIDGLTTMSMAEGATSVHHLYAIRVSEHKRDDLRTYLADKGIGTQVHYPIPPHLQQALKHLGHQKGDFPVAEQLANSAFSLPIYPGLSESEIAYVCDTLKSFHL